MNFHGFNIFEQIFFFDYENQIDELDNECSSTDGLGFVRIFPHVVSVWHRNDVSPFPSCI